MSRLTELGVVEYLPCEPNFAYTLTDKATFLPTEYKVLQSQESGCFVRCMDLMYNGRKQFYYLTDGYRPLAELIPALTETNFQSVVYHLLNSVIQIKRNGFLSLQNVESSFDKIFVDPDTLHIRLIYLPIAEGFFPDDASFEAELREELVRLIVDNPRWKSARTMRLEARLTDSLKPLESMVGTLPDDYAVQQNNVRAQLVTADNPSKVVFRLNKDEYIIGRKAGAADGVILDNGLISRTHCRITIRGEEYYIEDLNSVNGTYVNQIRLRSGQRVPLRDGDKICLADCEFLFQIR